MIESNGGTCFEGQGTFQRLSGEPTHLQGQRMELDSEICPILASPFIQLRSLNEVSDLLSLSGLVGEQ